MQRRLRFAAPVVITFACAHPPPFTPLPTPSLAHPDRVWSMHHEPDGSCDAEERVDCPEDADCNPPEPTVYRCVDGVAHGVIDRVGAGCWLEGATPRQVICPDDVPQPHESSPPAPPDWLRDGK